MWYYGGVLTTALLETELGIVLDVCLCLCAHYLPIYYTCLFILFSSSFYIFLHLKIGPFSTRIIGQGGGEGSFTHRVHRETSVWRKLKPGERNAILSCSLINQTFKLNALNDATQQQLYMLLSLCADVSTKAA